VLQSCDHTYVYAELRSQSMVIIYLIYLLLFVHLYIFCEVPASLQNDFVILDTFIVINIYIYIYIYILLAAKLA